MNAGAGPPDADDADAIESRPRPNLLADQQFPAAPRQERTRRARDGLLTASLALFAEKGYDATAVDEIARRAGVAVGGFYLHFRSKRQVLRLLMDALLREVETRFDTLGDATRLPERLLSSDFDSPYAGVYRAWREAALRDASIAALDAEIEAWTSARIAAALRAVPVRPGARATVDLRAFAWMLSVLWWQFLERARHTGDELTHSAAALVQSVLFEDSVLQNDLQPLPAEETL